MIQSILKAVKLQKCIDTQADGTGTTSSDILDGAGANSAFCAVAFGDVDNTSVITLKAYVGDESDLSDGAYLTTTATYTAAAADADNKMLVLDCKRLTKRYIRFDVVVATANATIEAGISGVYNYKAEPVTQSSDVIDGELALS
jgi:hypothetical protein